MTGNQTSNLSDDYTSWDDPEMDALDTKLRAILDVSPVPRAVQSSIMRLIANDVDDIAVCEHQETNDA